MASRAAITSPGPGGPGASAAVPDPSEGARVGDRVAQVVMALILAVVSALVMVMIHRQGVEALGSTWPTGLLLGGVIQLAASTFLLASTGRRLPLVVLAVAWSLVAMPFAGQSAGGSVLMPAELGGAVQYQGWIVQLLGIAIPLLVLAADWATRIRRLAARQGQGPTADGARRP